MRALRARRPARTPPTGPHPRRRDHRGRPGVRPRATPPARPGRASSRWSPPRSSGSARRWAPTPTASAARASGSRCSGAPPDLGPTSASSATPSARGSASEPDYPAAQAYAAGLVAARCAEIAGSLDDAALRRAAARLDLTTFYGRFRLDPQAGQQVGHAMVVAQWQAGRKQIVWPASPRRRCRSSCASLGPDRRLRPPGRLPRRRSRRAGRPPAGGRRPATARAPCGGSGSRSAGSARSAPRPSPPDLLVAVVRVEGSAAANSALVYGCCGLSAQLLALADLDDLAQVHHRDLVADVGHRGQVVADEQVATPSRSWRSSSRS